MGRFMRTQEGMDQLGFVRGPARLLAAPLSQAPPTAIGQVVRLGAGSDINEVQTITITGAPTGGTFTLSFAGATTEAIPYNADASTVRANLESLSTIGGGNVAVTGSAGGPYVVTFQNNLGNMDVVLISATGSFTGGTTPAIAVVETTKGQGEYDALGSWFDLGGTKTGVQSGYNFGQEEFTIDQYSSSIGSLPNNHEMWMQTQLVEVTAEKIQFAWEGSAITVNTTVTPHEKKVGVGTPSSFRQWRLCILHRRHTGLLRIEFIRIAQRAPLESTRTYASTGDQQTLPLRMNAQVDSAVADERERFGYQIDQLPS